MNEIAETAEKVCKIILTAKADIANQFLTIGRALEFSKAQGIYKHVNGCRTFDEFVNELGLSRSTAYSAMRVWQNFGEYDVDGIPHDRLVRLLPLEIDEEEKEEWVEKARNLRAEDFNNEIREARGEVPTDACEHTEVKLIKKCRCCGKWFPDEETPLSEHGSHESSL